ncbi:MAG: hypothetical protein KDD46_02075 [Bdellovibrionales bacterium]|nr:hypothetical protein [Bdellovibrionales bacterium]
MPKARSTKISNTTTGVVPPIFDVSLDDDFFGDIDKAFAKIQMDTPKTSTKITTTKRTKAKTGRTSTTGITQMRNTYVELVNLTLSPVVRYLKAFEFGVDSTDLTTIMEYIVSPLIVKAKQVGLKAETSVLDGFVRVLRKINRSGGRISAEQMNELMENFERVITTFRLEYRGHSTAVVNLVCFFRSLKRKNKLAPADLKKIFAIGIPSMTMIRKISLSELVSLTGLSSEKASWVRKQARTFTLFEFV